jgi:hypothetical protein
MLGGARIHSHRSSPFLNMHLKILYIKFFNIFLLKKRFSKMEKVKVWKMYTYSPGDTWYMVEFLKSKEIRWQHQDDIILNKNFKFVETPQTRMPFFYPFNSTSPDHASSVSYDGKTISYVFGWRLFDKIVFYKTQYLNDTGPTWVQDVIFKKRHPRELKMYLSQERRPPPGF